MARPLISLIVPIWGDDDLVATLIESTSINSGDAEWIVAAVDPSHRLREMEKANVIRLIACNEPSRGRQMNAGAAVARGKLICFHHADSELKADHVESLIHAAGDESVIGGAFHRRFDDRHPWMQKWEGVVRDISCKAGPLFGDQSLFVRTEVFRRMGGFADIPLMEDIEFSRRLRRLGPIVLLDPPIWSSPRRFRKMGNIQASLMNGTLILLYYLGIDPRTLHRWYYHKARREVEAGNG